jgi:hypothetical protein
LLFLSFLILVLLHALSFSLLSFLILLFPLLL